MSNLLKNEKSPYLKQHENNPVHWYPWGKKALEKSKRNTIIPILRPNILVTFVAPVEPLPMLCKFFFEKNFVII